MLICEAERMDRGLIVMDNAAVKDATPTTTRPMSNISEARADVYAQLDRLVALVEREEPRTATEVEVALWGDVLRLGAGLMRLFFSFFRL